MPNDCNPRSSLPEVMPRRSPGIIEVKSASVGSIKKEETETVPEYALLVTASTMLFAWKLIDPPEVRFTNPPLAAGKVPVISFGNMRIFTKFTALDDAIKVLDPGKKPFLSTVTYAASLGARTLFKRK